MKSAQSAMFLCLRKRRKEITRNEAKKLLPVITAFAEGKHIEHRTTSAQPWTNLGAHAVFQKPSECYRVKPEPVVRYFLVLTDGTVSNTPFAIESDAKGNIAVYPKTYSHYSKLVQEL